jgi:large subunit ribosomal protein L22
MKALSRSVRMAPKKVNIIAKMIRGLPVGDALQSLERTHKKAARIMERLLTSAVANAHHNDKQDPDSLYIRTVVVNKGRTLHRGVPMARGRVRPIRKFLSHISLTLGAKSAQEPASDLPQQKKDSSQKADAPKTLKKTQATSSSETSDTSKTASPSPSS